MDDNKNDMKELYEQFLKDYPLNVEINDAMEINHYYIIMKRIIDLYEKEKYDEFSKLLSIFLNDEMYSDLRKIHYIFDRYTDDLYEEVVEKFDDKLKNVKTDSELYNVLTNFRNIFTTFIPYDIKQELIKSYLKKLEEFNYDMSDIIYNVDLAYYIDEVILNDLRNKEKEELAHAANIGVKDCHYRLALIQEKIDQKKVQLSIKEDTDEITAASKNMVSKQEVDGLIEAATDVISEKFDFIDGNREQFLATHEEVATKVKKACSNIENMVSLKSVLSNLELFRNNAKFFGDVASEKADVNQMIEKVDGLISKSQTYYKMYKNGIKNLMLDLNDNRKEFHKELKNLSLKEVTSDIFSVIKNVKDKLADKVSKFKEKSKKTTKRQVASLVGAAVIGFSGLSVNASAVSKGFDDSISVQSNIDTDDLSITSNYDIPKALKALKSNSDPEIKNYIRIINEVSFKSNSKYEITDSMLYSLGMCASNWDSNCEVLGINETWQDRINKMVKTISSIDSVNVVSNDNVGWMGITHGFGKEMSEISIDLNDSFHGKTKALLHECVHAEQAKYLTKETVKGTYGEMPNDIQIQHFLQEFHANLINGLADSYLLGDGFPNYKDIEGQGFGLMLITGSNEFLDFMSNNKFNETFPDFVRRRFVEQGFSMKDANDYLISLQNSLIGTLDYYNVSKKKDNIGTTPFEREASSSYEISINDFNNDPMHTFERNYNEASDIVFRVLRKRLLNASNEREIKRAIYDIGTYFDRVSCNDLFYIKDGDKTIKVDSSATYVDKQNSLNEIYDDMYNACFKIIPDFKLPYEQFRKIFNGYFAVKNSVEKIKIANQEYLLKMNVTSKFSADYLEQEISSDIVDIMKGKKNIIQEVDSFKNIIGDVENFIKEAEKVDLSGLDVDVEDNKIIEDEVEIPNVQSITKQSLFQEIQNYFTQAKINELGKENIMGFMHRMNNLIDDNSLTLEGASQLFNDFKNGKISLNLIAKIFTDMKVKTGGKSR